MAPDTDPSTGVPSPYNTLGVTAQGILDCYKKLRLSRLLNACVNTYDAMVRNAENPSPPIHRIRGPDIPFLVELSEGTGNSRYAKLAEDRFQEAVDEFGGGTATGFAEYIRDIRKGQALPSVISWDVNLYIQGVLALDRYCPGEGYSAQASAMAEVIHNSLYVMPVDFDINGESQNEFWIGIAGALDAFVTTRTHPDKEELLTTKLVAGQQPDGRFIGVLDGSDIQTTAYAILALNKVGKDHAVVSALNYLSALQLPNDGWAYDGGENTEVTSEVVQAIFDRF